MPQYKIEVKEELTDKAIELRAKGKSFDYIATEIGVAPNTARKWVHAGYATRSEHRSVSDAREHSIAVYQSGIEAAWERFDRMRDNSTNVVGLLNNIRQFQERIDKLTGAEAPIKLQEVDEEYEIVWEDADSLAAAE